MRKFIISFVLAALWVTTLTGARAYPGQRRVMQPDGTSLIIEGHGDEFSHHISTRDGYSVKKCDDGFYRYTLKEGDRVKSSNIIAHDEAQRTAEESSFLKSIDKHIESSVSPTGLRLKRLSMRTGFSPIIKRTVSSSSKKVFPRQVSAGDSYRGLVILVNFQDKKFSRGEKSLSLADEMMNRRNRTYYDDPLLNGRISCTGSVRDYFEDNSGGLFLPEFDVVGPIEVSESQFFIDGTEKTYELCAKVLKATAPHIDFSKYDCDGDGEVDMIYILYAGHSSSYQGNDERLVWPHAGHFGDSDIDLKIDGLRIGRFACSSELFGWTDDTESYLDGIGVIVHEFSHVLGFKDHYDVSGYLNEDPGSWDVMASGNYNGVLNDTPCGYSSYEKYAAGFITPRTLDVKDEGNEVTLRDLYTSGDACRIVSMQDSAVFMLENRQPVKWDHNLPGHGMLVWRVDSCDAHYWEHNALNVNNRLHLKLIRANGPTFNIFREMDDTDYDPFPGSRNVTSLSNYTRESNMLTDFGYPSPLGLYDITESDGVITFTIESDPYAGPKPYTFSPLDTYPASGLLINEGEEREMKWRIRMIKSEGSGGRNMISDLVPDTESISQSDPKYADGLKAPYIISPDRMSLTIEPTRVALLDNMGVWLVDFTALDKGGSGAIQLDMDPYGNLKLSDPESIIGYCTMPKSCIVVNPTAIVDKFSMIRNLNFDSNEAGVTYTPADFLIPKIFNLQGFPVNNPQKGQLYIINGKKVIY